MPVYEYRCRTCNHEFEIQQAMSDDALTECPECGGELRKVFSPVGIAFKGSGFYKNDSGSRSRSASAPSSDSPSSVGTSDSGTSDSGSGGSSSTSDSASSSDSSSSGSSSSDSTGSGSKATAGSTSSAD